MDNIENKENKMPKSLGRIGYNTAFKDNIQLKKNIQSKNQMLASRTPLKSNMNIMNMNQQPIDNKENKCLKYPLLKSVSSSNINTNNYNKNDINNNNIDEEDEKYNENALEDEPEDFIHMNENKVYINNDNDYEEEINNFLLKRKELQVGFLNDINPFAISENNNKYVLGAHFDEKEKKEYDDYFKSPDEDVLDEDL